MKRTAFIEFLSAGISASEDSLAEEARTQILPRMKTSTDFLARFTRPLSPAAVGAMSFVSQDDDEIEETEEEKVLLQLGLSNASSQAFEEFLGTLSPTNKLLAKLFYKAHTCSFDAEFSAIAAAEMTNVKFDFAWTELLKPSEEHKNQKVNWGLGAIALSRVLYMDRKQACCSKQGFNIVGHWRRRSHSEDSSPGRR